MKAAVPVLRLIAWVIVLGVNIAVWTYLLNTKISDKDLRQMAVGMSIYALFTVAALIQTIRFIFKLIRRDYD